MNINEINDIYKKCGLNLNESNGEIYDFDLPNTLQTGNILFNSLNFENFQRKDNVYPMSNKNIK